MKRPIVVSRGSYADHEIVVVEVIDSDGIRGVGECCPIAHYDQSGAKVVAALDSISGDVGSLTRAGLLDILPPGPARNGLDCALWDLEAKREGISVWQLAGITPPASQPTAITLMMASPDDMAAQAVEASAFGTLKLKLGRNMPAEAIIAVRRARPDALLAIDANEGWSLDELIALEPAMKSAGIFMVEQPLKAGSDHDLKREAINLDVCADESFHSSSDMADVSARYEFINIKLDKCGGLTEAIRILDRAPDYGLKSMVGCMFGTSLANAPALVVASRCDFADLDGPLLIIEEREGGALMCDGAYLPTTSSLWGGLHLA